jgi:hypothetical protein
MGDYVPHVVLFSSYSNGTRITQIFIDFKNKVRKSVSIRCICVIRVLSYLAAE